jgi:hypothetical protein
MLLFAIIMQILCVLLQARAREIPALRLRLFLQVFIGLADLEIGLAALTGQHLPEELFLQFTFRHHHQLALILMLIRQAYGPIQIHRAQEQRITGAPLLPVLTVYM